MRNYMPKVGSYGLDMMFRTCTVQVLLFALFFFVHVHHHFRSTISEIQHSTCISSCANPLVVVLVQVPNTMTSMRLRVTGLIIHAKWGL
jgi:hypothetical protein